MPDILDMGHQNNLAFQRLDPFPLIGADALSGTGIDLMATNPFVNGLWCSTDLGGYGLSGGPKRCVFTKVLLNHAPRRAD